MGMSDDDSIGMTDDDVTPVSSVIPCENGMAGDFPCDGFDAIESNDGSIVLVGESASVDFPSINHKGGADLIILKVH